MSQSTVKEALKYIVERLPEGCSWDEVISWIYVRQKIEEGLADIRAGRTETHEVVFKEFQGHEDRLDLGRSE